MIGYRLVACDTYGSFRITEERASSLPVAFTTALLLGAAWVNSGMPGFGEVAREVFFWSGGAIGKADMVTISSFVGASHCFAVLATSTLPCIWGFLIYRVRDSCHDSIGVDLFCLDIKGWDETLTAYLLTELGEVVFRFGVVLVTSVEV